MNNIITTNLQCQENIEGNFQLFVVSREDIFRNLPQTENKKYISGEQKAYMSTMQRRLFEETNSFFRNIEANKRKMYRIDNPESIFTKPTSYVGRGCILRNYNKHKIDMDELISFILEKIETNKIPKRYMPAIICVGSYHNSDIHNIYVCIFNSALISLLEQKFSEYKAEQIVYFMKMLTKEKGIPYEDYMDNFYEKLKKEMNIVVDK